MLTAALNLFKQLIFKLKSRTSHCVDVLKASISLILFAVTQLKAHCSSDEKNQKHETIIKSTFDSLKRNLLGWISDPEVIGGSLFGGNCSTFWKSNSKDELKVLHVFFYIVCLKKS